MCHVQDGGLILNRLAAESQINGGMIQSIGMALYEQRVMDSKLGVMLNAGFGDYKLPGLPGDSGTGPRSSTTATPARR